MSRSQASIRFDWTMTILAAVFLGGLYLDGWAHTHGRVDDTFFTPWHAVLYGGWLACTAFLIGAWTRGRAWGRGWREALPAGYGLSLLGGAAWLVAGPADLVWHQVFGFEVSVEALMSPAHLALVLGAALVLSGPLRSAWGRADLERQSWTRRLPMLLSLTFVLSQITFFLQIGHPIANLWGRGTARPERFANLIQEAGITGILLASIVLVGAVLLLLHRGGAPAGALTVMLGLNAVAMGFLYGRGPYPLAPVLAFVIAGVLGDLLRAMLRPGAARPVAWRWFAFAVPVVLHLLYFASLALTAGLWWTVHLWLGTVLFTGVAGWLLSYLVLPPRAAAAAPEPTGGARLSASWAARPAGSAPSPVGSGR
jgi:hypothetical protein